MTQTELETFKSEDQVFFQNPANNPDFAEKLKTYIRAVRKKGPFYVVKTEDTSHDPEASHPQVVTLGLDARNPLMVVYSSGHTKSPPEPLEVSGYWLTKKEW